MNRVFSRSTTIQRHHKAVTTSSRAADRRDKAEPDNLTWRDSFDNVPAPCNAGCCDLLAAAAWKTASRTGGFYPPPKTPCGVLEIRNSRSYINAANCEEVPGGLDPPPNTPCGGTGGEAGRGVRAPPPPRRRRRQRCADFGACISGLSASPIYNQGCADVDGSGRRKAQGARRTFPAFRGRAGAARAREARGARCMAPALYAKTGTIGELQKSNSADCAQRS